MLIGILIGIAVIVGIMSVLGETFKKVLEILSAIAKFCVGAFVSMMIQQAVLPNLGTWGRLAFIVIGGLIVYVLVETLSSAFRLVGYSINYFTNSIVILLITGILGDKISITFVLYAIILFVFPRIMWISDRFATTSDFSHSEYSAWDNVTTFFYTVKDVDHYGSSEHSWNHIPLQILIASVFFAVGSCTIFGSFSIESVWLQLLYIILSTAVNVIFDLFVFRKIDK